MRTVLICHAGDVFDREGLAAWLASFSHLAGVVVLEENAAQQRARIRRELDRVGLIRFVDVIAMRTYQKLFLARHDARWLERAIAELHERFGSAPQVPTMIAASANDARVVAFLRQQRPDIVIARCKQLLSKKVIATAGNGIFVMHPGICPEYRNAHGCFWALAARDHERVGMTLLRIDAGIDTGPIFGYYRYAYDERRESHVVIQYRVVLENLDAVAHQLAAIHDGSAAPIDTTGRASGVWGQPWLSRYLRWQRASRTAA